MARIVVLCDKGFCVKIGCNKTAVHTVIVTFQNSGTFIDKVRSRYPRKTSARDDNLMNCIVTQSPTTSDKKINVALLQNDTNVTLRFDFVLKSFKLTCKPQLTAAIKCKHLAFVKQHETWIAGQSYVFR